MKGHFSVEWLSQSSQSSDRHRPTAPAYAAVPEVPQPPCASGTVTENLPGFYRQCRPVQRQPEEPISENHHIIATHHQQNSISENHIISTHHQQNMDNRGNFQQCVQGLETTGFQTEEEEETSGYESEGGHSLSPGVMKDSSPETASPPSGRRPRTAFTSEQITSLEKAFKRNAYLGTQDKADLCKRLNLSDKQIRNWFQNRRMKLKRTVQDALAHACQAKVASHLLQYSDLQSYRPAPYPSFYPPQEAAAAASAYPSYYHSTQEASAAYMPSASLHYSRPVRGGHLHTVPVDALYQYNGLPVPTVPALAVSPATTTRMVSYQPYTAQFQQGL